MTRPRFQPRFSKPPLFPRSLSRVAAFVAVACALLSVLPAVAHAWGRNGHQIVGWIADQEMKPETRQKVAELLAQETPPAEAPAGLPPLALFSTWADEVVRDRRETGPWHYVDIPATEPGYVAERDCPAEACVVAQIERLRGVLRAPETTPKDRAEALKFLVHFVGDVHQPLHAACMVLPPRPRTSMPEATCGGVRNSDRGGNEIKVRFGDLGINLHQVWDTELLYELRGTVPEIAKRLQGTLTDAQRKEWQAGNAVDWANESHALAQRVAYGLLPKEKRIVIPLRYETEARLTIETQLKRAGLRLARVLDEALATPQ